MSMIGVKRADSLAIRAVFSALIAVMLVSMVFSAAQVYLEVQDELKADRLALSRAVSASKPALVNAAYQLDSVLAQQLINGLLMNEIIDAVRLEDDSGAVLASGSNPPLDESMPLVSLLIDKSITREAIPLFKDPIDASADSSGLYGTLHLSIEPRRGMQGFSERNRQFLWIAILRIMLLVVVLTFILRRQIISPLQHVISDIQSLSALGLTIQKPKRHEQDEIGVLVSEVNASIERQKDQLKQIAENNKETQIIYPVHLNPNVEKPVYELLSGIDNIILVKPLAYAAFIWLMEKSYLIITDSGGIQEEAPSLGKPVLVTRDTTERPEAVEEGTVLLVGTDTKKIINETQKLISDAAYYKTLSMLHNPYGDGNATSRIVNFIKEI